MTRLSTHARWLVRAAMLAALPLAACSTAEKSADSAAANMQAAAQAQSTPTLSTSDTLFLDQAARAGMAEVAEGNLVATRASRASVRQYATQMVDDHSTVNQELIALAQRKGITPPSAPSDSQRSMLTALAKQHGRAFDRQYLDEQVADHQQVLKLFQDEAQQGTDPEVKAFAARHAGAMANHLDMAERLGGHAPAS